MVTTDFHTVHRAKILAHTLTLDFIILNWGRAKVSMVLRPALRGIKPESVLSSHRPRACWNTSSPLLSAASSPLFSAPSRPSREKRRLDLFRKETVVVQNFSLHAQKKVQNTMCILWRTNLIHQPLPQLFVRPWVRGGSTLNFMNYASCI